MIFQFVARWNFLPICAVRGRSVAEVGGRHEYAERQAGGEARETNFDRGNFDILKEGEGKLSVVGGR